MNETTQVVQIDVVIRGTLLTGPPRKYYVGTEIERFNRNGAAPRNLFRGEKEKSRNAVNHTLCV